MIRMMSSITGEVNGADVSYSVPRFALATRHGLPRPAYGDNISSTGTGKCE